MASQTFEYRDGETTCRGVLAHGDGAQRRPGILICHEAPGCDDHVKMRAGMLADLGYVALAADLYGEGKIAKGGDEAQALMGPLREDTAKLRRRARAGLDALAALPNVDTQRLAAIGYCFGGLTVLELARSAAPVVGVVSFHGILSTKAPEDARNIKGKVLACTGADDPLVPPEQVLAFQQEMTAANVDWQVITYGGTKHAFTNRNAGRSNRPNILAYNEAADRRSWAAMRAFFDEIFARA